MKNNDILKNYLNKESYSEKSLFSKIDDLCALFTFLKQNAFIRSDIDKDVILIILSFCTDNKLDDLKKSKLDKFLAYYIDYYANIVLDQNEEIVEDTDIIEKNEKTTIDSDILMNNSNTIDIKESDVPDKEYDWDFIEELGIEKDEVE